MMKSTLAFTALILVCLPAILFGRNLPATVENNKLTQGEFFQGDIRLVPGQLDKNGVLLDSLKWPNATVHYKLEGVYESNSTLTDLVMDAIADYHSKTCIKFEPYDGSQTAYIVLTDVGAAGCSSFFGRLGTKQIVDLKFPGCAYLGTIVHELMHAVGFIHEQSRMDRDEYVEIIWENIEFGYEFNFAKFPSETFNVSYDYESIVHYGETAFSSNDGLTIIPTDPFAVIGNTDRLSEKDVMKINSMYNCTGPDE